MEMVDTMQNNFRARLRNGDLLTGIFATLGIPETGEILSAAGVDVMLLAESAASLQKSVSSCG